MSFRVRREISNFLHKLEISRVTRKDSDFWLRQKFYVIISTVMFLIGSTVLAADSPPPSHTVNPPSSSFNAFAQFATFLDIVLKNYADQPRLDGLNIYSADA